MHPLLTDPTLPIASVHLICDVATDTVLVLTPALSCSPHPPVAVEGLHIKRRCASSTPPSLSSCPSLCSCQPPLVPLHAQVTEGLPIEPVRHFRVGGYGWGDMARVATNVPEAIRKYYNIKQ